MRNKMKYDNSHVTAILMFYDNRKVANLQGIGFCCVLLLREICLY